MSDFKQKIMAAAAFVPDAWSKCDSFAQDENVRLQPILTRLVDEVEALKAALEDIRWSWENDDGRQCDNLAYDAIAAHQKRWEDLK